MVPFWVQMNQKGYRLVKVIHLLFSAKEPNQKVLAAEIEAIQETELLHDWRLWMLLHVLACVEMKHC